MSATRGKRTTRGTSPGRPDGEEPDPGGRVPDLLRRVVGLGFSGFFLTEEVVRKTLGEKLPREWIEFAVEQSERTRRELIDRVAAEIGRTLDGVDLPHLAERLLRGHTLEVSARLRFVPRPDSEAELGRAFRVTVDEEEP
jgi:hypothetical protein